MLDTFLEGPCNKETHSLCEAPFMGSILCSSPCWTFVSLSAGLQPVWAMFPHLGLYNPRWSSNVFEF